MQAGWKLKSQIYIELCADNPHPATKRRIAKNEHMRAAAQAALAEMRLDLDTGDEHG